VGVKRSRQRAGARGWRGSRVGADEVVLVLLVGEGAKESVSESSSGVARTESSSCSYSASSRTRRRMVGMSSGVGS
jgi:hypothetical protein